jgi:tRNA threonylcarbamoyl adenosine modification protein (Sua5/YciO/YrdC/YwlC family)
LQEEALHAVKHLWPNSISIVIPTKEADTYLDLGKGSLAVRIPKDDVLLAVLRRTGPLVTSSANLFDQPPATTFEEAQAYFTNRVDFYVDVGDLSHRPPSTIARFTEDGRIEILRQGAVTIDDKGRLL